MKPILIRWNKTPIKCFERRIRSLRKKRSAFEEICIPFHKKKTLNFPSRIIAKMRTGREEFPLELCDVSKSAVVEILWKVDCSPSSYAKRALVKHSRNTNSRSLIILSRWMREISSTPNQLQQQTNTISAVVRVRHTTSSQLSRPCQPLNQYYSQVTKSGIGYAIRTAVKRNTFSHSRSRVPCQVDIQPPCLAPRCIFSSRTGYQYLS